MCSVKCVNDKRVIHLIVIYAHCLAASNHCTLGNAMCTEWSVQYTHHASICTKRDPECNKRCCHQPRAYAPPQQQQHRTYNFEMAIAIFSETRCFAYEKHIYLCISRVVAAAAVLFSFIPIHSNSFIDSNERNGSKQRYESGYHRDGASRKKECACVAYGIQQIFSMRLCAKQLCETHFLYLYLISQKCSGKQTKV